MPSIEELVRRLEAAERRLEQLAPASDRLDRLETRARSIRRGDYNLISADGTYQGGGSNRTVSLRAEPIRAGVVVAIAHYLDYPPAVVVAVPDREARIWRPKPPDATRFYLSCDVDCNVFWSAE